MKRLISIALTISIIVSMCIIPVTGLAAGINFLVAESFNAIATGKIPENGAQASDTALVSVSADGRDKALEMAAYGDSSLSYTVESDSKVLSVYADLKFTDNWSAANFYIINSGGKKFNLAYIDENGKLYSGDNRMYSGFPKNITSSIQITYDMDLKKASIYMGGNCLESYRYLGSGAFSDVTGFGVDVVQSEKSSLLLDNFAVFEGAQKIKSSAIPKTAFNPEVYAVITPGDNEEYIGDSVFFTRTFDEKNRPEFDGLQLSKDAETTVETNAMGDNKYIRIKKTNAENNITFSGDSTARYIVMSADISTDSSPIQGILYYGYDGASASLYNAFLRISAGGDVTALDGTTIAKIQKNKWVNIAVASDVKKLKFDVYADGELKAKGLSFDSKDFKKLSSFVIGTKGAGDSGSILVDNILVYEGKEPREIDASVRKSLLPSDNTALNYIGKNRVINPYSDIMHVDRVKYFMQHEAVLEENDNVAYAHRDDLKILFGEEVNLTSPHSSKSDYYNVEETGINSGYQIQKMDTRLMIFNNNPVNISSEKLDEILRYMTGARPKADVLTAKFNETSAGQHPRILINKEDLNNIIALYKSDSNMNKWGKDIISRADAILLQEEYTHTITAEKSMTGVRELVEDIRNISLAYYFTNDQRYLDRAWSLLDNACSLEQWNRYSQLFQGEMGYAVAIGYDWLYDYWTDEQKQILESKLFEEGLKYTEKIYYGDYTGIPDSAEKGWWGAKNNWNFVCNSTGIAMAAALYDIYPEVSASLIENAIHSYEYASQVLYPYGAYDEGGDYWEYAVCYMISGIMTLRTTFGTDFGLSKMPAFDKTGWYISKLTATTGIIALGDSGTAFISSPHTMFLAKEFSDSVLMSARIEEMNKLGQKGDALTMIYYEPSLADNFEKLSLDTHMPGTEAVVLREDWHNRGAASVAAAGGDNNRNHGHMDIGTYVVDMAGERFVQCVGTERYDADGIFSDKRYYYYTNRTEGHNLYMINPENSLEYFGANPDAHAAAEIVTSKPRGAVAKINLNEAYEPWANSAIRGIMLGDDRRSVTIRDEISLKNPDSDIYWFFHTTAKIESVVGNTVVLSKNGKKIVATVTTNASEWVLEEVDPSTLNEAAGAYIQNSNKAAQGYRKIQLKAKASGDVYISIKYKQYDDDMIAAAPVDLPIAAWTIPDGEVVPLPEAKAIYIDGKIVDDFDPFVTGYSRLVPTNQTFIPAITAEADTPVEVIQAGDFGEDAIVRVYSADNPAVYRTYRVNIYKLPPLKDVNGLKRYQVAQITASAVPQIENGPTNVVDGDYSTRWAAEGNDGHWIMLELDDVYPINKVGVSWHSGDVRKYRYKLEVSADGNSWTQIFDGESSGTTLKSDYVEAGGIMAKYVRCLCFGNNQNLWNSMTEFEVLGGQGTDIQYGIFTDMPYSHWSYSAVESLADKNIISGYNDGSFRPDNTVTRAEYTKLILGAYEAVHGKTVANEFKKAVTEAASVSASEKIFADVSANDWFAPYVSRAASIGLVNGSGYSFSPDNNITREDAAVILYRMISSSIPLNGSYSFADSYNIADYAKDAVNALASDGIISGSGNNMFNPKSNLTRAEAAKLIYGGMEKLGA